MKLQALCANDLMFLNGAAGYMNHGVRIGGGGYRDINSFIVYAISQALRLSLNREVTLHEELCTSVRHCFGQNTQIRKLQNRSNECVRCSSGPGFVRPAE